MLNVYDVRVEMERMAPVAFLDFSPLLYEKTIKVASSSFEDALALARTYCLGQYAASRVLSAVFLYTLDRAVM